MKTLKGIALRSEDCKVVLSSGASARMSDDEIRRFLREIGIPGLDRAQLERDREKRRKREMAR